MNQNRTDDERMMEPDNEVQEVEENPLELTQLSSSPPIHSIATWFLQTVHRAELLDDTVNYNHVYHGMLYLYNLKRHRVDLTYARSDLDMWLLLWIVHSDALKPHTEKMREFVSKAYDLPTVPDLMIAKNPKVMAETFGKEMPSQILQSSILKLAETEQGDLTLNTARKEFYKGLQQHMDTGNYANRKQLLTEIFPFVMPVESTPGRKRIKSRVATPPPNPLPHFWEIENGQGLDAEPYVPVGADKAANPTSAIYNCVILCDNGKSSVRSSRESLSPDDRTSLRITVTTNSSLPGINIHTHDTAGYSFSISPDMCEIFNIEITSKADDVEQWSQVTDRWRLDLIHAAKSVGKMFAIELTCVLKDNQYPVCYRIGTEPPDEPRSDVMAAARMLKTLTLVDFKGHCHNFTSLRNALDLRGLVHDGKPVSFPLYRRCYPDADHATQTISKVVRDGWADDKKFPPVPIHLYRTQEPHRKGFRVLPSPQVMDLTRNAGSNHPCITSIVQLTDVMAIALLREIQMINVLYKRLNTLHHTGTFQTVNSDEGSSVYMISIQLSMQVEKELRLPVGTTVRFTIEPDQTTPQPPVAEGISLFAGTLWNGTVVYDRPHGECTFTLLSKMPGNLDEARRRNKSLDPVFGTPRPFKRDVRLKLAPNHRANNLQLSSLVNFQQQVPKDGYFALARTFFSTGVKPNYILNIENGFVEKSERSDGQPFAAGEKEDALASAEKLRVSLNDKQRYVVDICNRRAVNGLVVMTGPPGTGKSHVLSVLVLHSMLYEAGRIIVGAKTNKAVDVLFAKVEVLRRNCPSLEKAHVVRLLTPRQETFLREKGILDELPRADGDSNTKGIRMENEETSLAWKTRALARESAESQDHIFAEFGKLIKQYEARRASGNRLSRDEKNIYTEQAIWAEGRYLHCFADAVFGTVDTLAHEVPERDLHSHSCFLDEGSQMMLTELCSILVPNRKVRRVVIAGDPAQITPNPRTASSKLNEWGTFFSSSIFDIDDDYTNFYQDQQIYLTVNYRNTASVIKLANALSYSANPLSPVDMRGDWSKHGVALSEAAVMRENSVLAKGAFDGWDFIANPIVFVHVADQAVTRQSLTGSGFSWPASKGTAKFDFPRPTQRWHPGGDRAIVESVRSFIEDAHVPSSDIAVYSNYKRDAELIDAELRDVLGTPVDVGTIDSAQGAENEIVFVHLVTCSNDAIGYVGKRNRLNVAITRSRGPVIIVGNVDELVQVCKQRPTHVNGLNTLRDFIFSNKLIVDWDRNYPHHTTSLTMEGGGEKGQKEKGKRPMDDEGEGPRKAPRVEVARM